MRLELFCATDSMDLDGLLSGTTGTQILEGLTGTGLPPVEVQWSEGAGHGAAYRGSRVLPRDFDLPLLLHSETRAGLNRQLSTLARILDPLSGGMAQLRATVPNVGIFHLTVVRTGGGEVTYGNGGRHFTAWSYWMNTVIQLRAGDAFWNAADTSSASIGGGGGVLTLDNTGDARAWPTWELSGPSAGLSITNPAGQRLALSGGYDSREPINITAVSGKVLHAWSGESLYHLLDPAPRFTPIDPGPQKFTVSIPGATSDTRLTCTWRTRRWALI